VPALPCLRRKVSSSETGPFPPVLRDVQVNEGGGPAFLLRTTPTLPEFPSLVAYLFEVGRSFAIPFTGGAWPFSLSKGPLLETPHFGSCPETSTCLFPIRSLLPVGIDELPPRPAGGDIHARLLDRLAAGSRVGPPDECPFSSQSIWTTGPYGSPSALQTAPRSTSEEALIFLEDRRAGAAGRFRSRFPAFTKVRSDIA